MQEHISEERLHGALEEDIARLAQEVQRSRETSGRQHLPEKERVRHSLERVMPSLTLRQAPSAPAGNGEASPLLPSYTRDVPPETKLEIEHLLDLALHKGLAAADKAALRATPFVLDAFHDALTETLYPELKKRGIVK